MTGLELILEIEEKEEKVRMSCRGIVCSNERQPGGLEEVAEIAEEKNEQRQLKVCE